MIGCNTFSTSLYVLVFAVKIWNELKNEKISSEKNDKIFESKYEIVECSSEQFFYIVAIWCWLAVYCCEASMAINIETLRRELSCSSCVEMVMMMMMYKKYNWKTFSSFICYLRVISCFSSYSHLASTHYACCNNRRAFFTLIEPFNISC